MVSKYFFTYKEVFVDQIHNCTTVFHSIQVVNINKRQCILYIIIFYLNPCIWSSHELFCVLKSGKLEKLPVFLMSGIKWIPYSNLCILSLHDKLLSINSPVDPVTIYVPHIYLFQSIFQIFLDNYPRLYISIL